MKLSTQIGIHHLHNTTFTFMKKQEHWLSHMFALSIKLHDKYPGVQDIY